MTDERDELGQIADRLLELERDDELFNCTAHLVLAARRALAAMVDLFATPATPGSCDCAACQLELRLRAFASTERADPVPMRRAAKIRAAQIQPRPKPCIAAAGRFEFRVR